MSPDGCPNALGQPSPRTVCPGWGNPKPKGLRRRDTIDSPLAVLICASFSVYSPSGSKHEGDDASGPPVSACSGQPPTDAQLRPAPPCPTHCFLPCFPSSSLADSCGCTGGDREPGPRFCVHGGIQGLLIWMSKIVSKDSQA